jgi:hypothetical protein
MLSVPTMPTCRGGAGWAANSCALMTFCPERAGRMQVLYPDGSSLVTSAALSRPPSVAQRHQFDYAFDCLELRSVDFTAALDDNSLPQAVDATSSTKRSRFEPEVCHTAAA